MKVYGQVKDLMIDELEHICRRGELTPANLEVVDKAVDIIKDIETITAMESSQGYSYNGNSYENQGNSTRYPYYPIYGNSFERGRGDYAQRDSMGRYSREGNSMSGYYMAGSNTKEELKRLMEKATNETEKEAIRVAIESMNN